MGFFPHFKVIFMKIEIIENLRYFSGSIVNDLGTFVVNYDDILAKDANGNVFPLREIDNICSFKPSQDFF